jgi:hypothetical protein
MGVGYMRRHANKFVRLFKPDREKDRYYLLPGMGGRALRRKQKVILSWTAVAGLATASVVGAILYLMNRN